MCPPASSGTAPVTTQQQQGQRLTEEVPDCVPSDPISRAAYEYATQHLEPTILNHSIRVYLYPKAISERENQDWTSSDKIHLLFAACILHDLGTATVHDGPERFEVEGADAAASLLLSHNVSENEIHDVWVAIALHTSPGIAERITPLARLVRLGVTIDFKRPTSMALTNDAEVKEVEGRFPRGGIEKVLGDAVVEQAVGRPEKAPAASWPGVLVRSGMENLGWEGVNRAF